MPLLILHTKTKQSAVADELAAAFLDVVQIRLDITDEALAQACGVDRRHLVNERGAGFPHRFTRWAIEHHLGFLPIWSTGAEMEVRRVAFEVYGIDPRLATLEQLQEACRKLGVQKPNLRKWDAWCSNLMAWVAANRVSQHRNKHSELRKEI